MHRNIMDINIYYLRDQYFLQLVKNMCEGQKFESHFIRVLVIYR